MSHILTEQLVQKVLSQRACCPGCRDTDAQSTQIPNNEASDKEVNKIEYQVVDVAGKVRAILAGRLLVEFGCGLSKDKSHQGERSTNDDGTCESKTEQYAISRAGVCKDTL